MSSATSLTPFYMMYGRECNLPAGELSRPVDKLSSRRINEDEVEIYMNRLTMALECAWSYAVGKSEKNFLRFNSHLSTEENLWSTSLVNCL